MYIKQFQSIISQIDTSSIYVIDAMISKNSYVPLNLSKNNIELLHVDVSSSVELDVYINQKINNHKGQVAYGGYLETRNIYSRSTYFKKETNALEERNIHLGLDIWSATGTPVLAALDGEIHSFKNNLNYGDYGPTLILMHQIDNFTFYTLYGHLSIDSLTKLSVGQQFKQGDAIANLGASSVNGDYPPHLHFQIIFDLENNTGDYPGVTNLNNVEFYKNNCPNPNLLLGLS